MKKALLVGILVALLAFPVTSWAGAKLKISEDTQINLAFRIQNQFIATNDNSGGDGDSEENFNTRRQRFRLGGSITEYVKFFLQTDGGDVQMIDAFINIHYKNLINVIMGHNMAPASRQITTSSGGLMAIDRPNITNYNLSWGLNGKVGFNTGPNFAQGDQSLGVPGPNVRDDGVTLFTSRSFSDDFHGKAYFGVYDGIENDEDTLRYTARVQVNFFDPEPGYYNLSTYLGGKKTVGIGASWDYQEEIDTDTSGDDHDYNWYEVDGFVDYPVGPGILTAEASYQYLDLDGSGVLTTGGTEAKQTSGDGFYGQIGYFLPDYNIQPWYGFDYWNSDDSGDVGSFQSHRVGLTYFIKGHNANIKIGYEYFKAEEDDESKSGVPAKFEDKIHTFVTGFYVTF